MNLTCNVALYNAELELLDTKPFNVTLLESHSMKHIKDGEVPVGDSEVLQDDRRAECARCDGYTDVICITMAGCWEEILVGVVALLLVCAMLYCCFCKCVPCRIMNCCIKKAEGSKCGGKKSKKSKKKKKDKDVSSSPSSSSSDEEKDKKKRKKKKKEKKEPEALEAPEVPKKKEPDAPVDQDNKKVSEAPIDRRD